MIRLTPAPAPQPLPFWPGAPLTPQQIERHRAQVRAMQQGRVARWPQGLAQ